MKIRHALVSNSSSSSYLIFGAELDTYDMQEVIKKEYDKKLRSLADDYYDGNLDDISDDEKDETIVEAAYETGFIIPEYSDGECYLGLSWDKVKDDETGAEFKARVRKYVKDIVGKDVDCKTYRFVDYC